MEILIKAQVRRTPTRKIKSVFFLFLATSICIGSGCRIPKQPKISGVEKAYFSDLKAEYKCDVEREIDPKMLSKAQNKSTGSYLLRLYNWPCDSLSSTNLPSLSAGISQNLYCNVLNKDKKYNEIIIVFDCEYAKDSYHSKDFSYATDSLICP